MNNNAGKKRGTDDILAEELSMLYPQYGEKIAAGASRRSLDAELCGRGIISETELLNAYSKTFLLPAIEEEEFQNLEIFQGLQADFLIHYCCIPVKWNDGTIKIAVGDPYSLDEIGYSFHKVHNLAISFAMAKRSHIERAIQEAYMSENSSEMKKDEIEISAAESEETLRSLASEARIVRLVNEMFARAVELDASDVHIEPEEKKLTVRFRIDGILHEIMTPQLSLYPAVASRIKLIGGLNIAEKRLPQDGRTDLQIGKSCLDVRISTVPSMNGESIVLRILRKDSVDFSLENIGMNEKMREEFSTLINLPYGMILVVGPTGSGKSTTLYTVLSKINSLDKKIITIEDPVEYRTEGITQIQVNPKIGLTFANGLRHIVRQDPDIILVGEIRDRETAEISIHAALTGHLVFSTLHTNNAPGAVSRLIDMGIEPFLLSSSLGGVLSQRLVRRICKNCRGSGKNSEEKKCKNCSGRGFKGRIGIFELMTVNDEIRDAINRRCDSETLAKTASKYGMKPLIEDGREKVAAGITTHSEVLGVAVDV